MSMPTEPSESWWSANRRPFAASVGITSVLVCSLAVVVGLDRVLRTGIDALAALVALPFVVAFCVIVLFLIVFLPFVLLSALADAPGGDAVVNSTGKYIIAPYFRWIGKQRNPIFWGVPCGVVTALVCLAIIGHVRSAHERKAAAEAERKVAETRALLETAQADIRDEFARTSHLPQSLSVMDPYGRALSFVVIESSSMSSYTLTSLGPDGVVSGDDICVDDVLRRRESALRRLARHVRGADADPIRCARNR